MTTEPRPSVCWFCSKAFEPTTAKGRPPRYCSPVCKADMKRQHRRIRIADRMEQQRTDFLARQKASLIARYGPEGAALLLRTITERP